VSYHAQFQLANNSDFNGRCQSATTQQATSQFTDHIADRVKRGDVEILSTFVRLNAAGPGIADKADNGDGTIDQTKVSDADLLSLTQANWPVVAALYPETTP